MVRKIPTAYYLLFTNYVITVLSLFMKFEFDIKDIASEDSGAQQQISEKSNEEFIRELSFDIPVNQWTIIAGTFFGLGVFGFVIVFVFSHIPHNAKEQFASLSPTPSISFSQFQPTGTGQVAGISTVQQGPVEKPPSAVQTEGGISELTATPLPTTALTPTNAPASGSSSSPTNTPQPTTVPTAKPTENTTPAPAESLTPTVTETPSETSVPNTPIATPVPSPS